MKKYISFVNMTYDEKKECIYHHINKVGTDYINTLIEQNILEIGDCKKYKNSVGCPIVYIGVPDDSLNKNRNKSLGRKVFREINEKFPILEIVRVLNEMKNST